MEVGRYWGLGGGVGGWAGFGCGAGVGGVGGVGDAGAFGDGRLELQLGWLELVLDLW